MKKSVLVVLTLIILAIAGELTMAVTSSTSSRGYSVLLNAPKQAQSAYVNFILQASFGYFRNCSRKTAMFKTIESSGDDLYFDRSLLIPYLNDDMEYIRAGDCPLLMEPAPQIAFRILSQHNQGELLLTAVKSFRDKTGQAPSFCSKVADEQNIEANMAQLIKAECQI